MKNRIVCRHGDLLIREIGEIPKTAEKIEGNILALGEATGHAHKLDTEQVQIFRNGEQTYFELEEDAELVHQEHKPILIKRGTYAVINEREFNPFQDEIRKVND